MMEFKEGKSAPVNTCRPIDVAVRNNKGYFRRFRSGIIDVYDSCNNDQPWSTLPKCPVQDTSLVILPINETEYALHTIGGLFVHKDKSPTFVGDLYCLSKRPTADCTNTEHCWIKSPLPPLRVARKQATVVLFGKYLIVAGGRGDNGPSRGVEVLDLTTRRWSTVASLPQAVFSACGCICGDTLYIIGGCIFDERGNTINLRSAYKASLTRLIHSHDYVDKVFRGIADLCLYASACTTFHEKIFAIGGSTFDPECSESKSSNLVYVYNPEVDYWKKLNCRLTENRWYCFAATLTHPEPQLIVVGGYVTGPYRDLTNKVEILNYSKSGVLETFEGAFEIEPSNTLERKQKIAGEVQIKLESKQEEGQSSSHKRGCPRLSGESPDEQEAPEKKARVGCQQSPPSTPESPEYQVMVKCTSEIVGTLAMDPEGFALHLFEERIISKNIYDSIIYLKDIPQAKGRKLHGALMDCVQVSSSNFDKFIESLGKQNEITSDVISILLTNRKQISSTLERKQKTAAEVQMKLESKQEEGQSSSHKRGCPRLSGELPDEQEAPEKNARASYRNSNSGVIAQVSVEITNQEQQFIWNGYGLRLLIPEKSLPAGVENCILHISVYLSSPYEIPSDQMLVSAVYNVFSKPEVEFKQELTLEIQHCVNSTKLAFVRVADHLKPVSTIINGNFNDRYGSIKVKNFSWYMIVLKLLGLYLEAPSCDYVALQFYKVVRSNFEVKVKIAVCKNLDAHCSEVRRRLVENDHFYYDDDTVISINTEIQLEIEDDLALSVIQKLWKVSPVVEPMILRKEAIDQWSDSPNTSIPSFKLKAIFESSDTSQLCTLSRKLSLTCKNETLKTFNLTVSSQAISGGTAPGYSSSSSTRIDHVQLMEFCKRLNLDVEDIDKEVSKEHILVIYPHLEYWKRVAAHLDLTRADVQAIESEARPDERLMRLHMLQEWKAKKGLKGEATLKVLLEAIISCQTTSP